jgi:hypothetical protein
MNTFGGDDFRAQDTVIYCRGLSIRHNYGISAVIVTK